MSGLGEFTTTGHWMSSSRPIRKKQKVPNKAVKQNRAEAAEEVNIVEYGNNGHSLSSRGAGFTCQMCFICSQSVAGFKIICEGVLKVV